MEKKNIYQRILGVMKDVTYIQKSEKRVNNQYRFVSHDQVAAIIHPVLVNHGIVAVPTVKSLVQEDFTAPYQDNKGNWIEKKQQRTQVCLNVRFVNVDEPTDCVEMDAWGFGIDGTDKGPGKAVSYAYKYAMLKLFCLETGDDPDNYQPPEEKPTKKTLNDDQCKAIEAYVSKDKDLSEKILKGYKVKSLAEIEAKNFGPIMNTLQRRVQVSV